MANFKYIKREWKNGRWRYYYDEKTYDTAKARVNRAKNNIQKSAGERLGYELAENNADRSVRYNRILKRTAVGELKDEYQRKIDEETNKRDAAHEAEELARKRYEAGVEVYEREKEKLSTLKPSSVPQKIINRGIAAVLNILSVASARKK